MAEASPTNKNSLLKLAAPLHYRTRTGRTILMSVNSQSEITINAQSKQFWITDFVATIYNSDGTMPDGINYPLDDILISITIGGVIVIFIRKPYICEKIFAYF